MIVLLHGYSLSIQVKNSNQMEPEGLRRSLNELSAKGMQIKTLTTDRHIQVRKLYSANPYYAAIQTQYRIPLQDRILESMFSEKAILFT